jgi:hypothetical protein
MSIQIPAGKLRTLITVGAALVVCVGAHAQNGGGAGGAGGGGGQGRRGGGGQFNRTPTIVSVPVSVLVSGLKLSDLEGAKLTALHDQYLKDMTALRPAQGAQPDPDAREKMTALNSETTEKMTAVLPSDKAAKLPDFLKGLASYRTVGIPLEVLPALKLTDAQSTKIAAIADEATKASAAKIQELQQGGDRQAMMTAMQAMQKTNHDNAVAVLTAPQKKTLEDYIAAHPQPTFNGRGGGGGGNRRPGGAAGGNGPV